MTPNVQTYKPTAPWSAAGFAPGTGAPTRVVVHRTANPDANGLATMGYFDRARSASIHIVIDGSEVLLGVPWDRHAWHVKASQRAAALGFATSHPNVQGGRSRGDIHAIGIEVVERWIAEPLVGRGDPRRDAIIRSGEGIWWPDETVETLIWVLREFLPSEVGALPMNTHSELDPVTRSHDPDGIMRPSDLRALLAEAPQPSLDTASTPEEMRITDDVVLGARSLFGRIESDIDALRSLLKLQ